MEAVLNAMTSMVLKDEAIEYFINKELKEQCKHLQSSFKDFIQRGKEAFKNEKYYPALLFFCMKTSSHHCTSSRNEEYINRVGTAKGKETGFFQDQGNQLNGQGLCIRLGAESTHLGIGMPGGVEDSLEVVPVGTQ